MRTVFRPDYPQIWLIIYSSVTSGHSLIQMCLTESPVCLRTTAMATKSLRTATLLGLLWPLTQAFVLRPVSVKTVSGEVADEIRE